MVTITCSVFQNRGRAFSRLFRESAIGFRLTIAPCQGGTQGYIMQYPYSYEKKKLNINIPDHSEAFSDIDIDDFIGELLDLNIHARNEIMIDLRNVKHLNSSDLGALIKVKDLLFDNNINLVLLNPSENVLELLNIVGLSDFFGVAESNQQPG